MANIGRIDPGAAASAAGADASSAPCSSGEAAGELDTMLGVFRGTATMGLGTRGEAVKAVQGFLKTLGYDLAAEDGVFGRRTQSAVAAFQRDARLSATGEVDGATYGALEAKAEAARRPAPVGGGRGGAGGPETKIAFASGYTQAASGDLVAGGKLVIDYDIARASSLRHTHNGYPAWGIDAEVRFLPSGETVSGPVMEFESVMGRPTNTPRPKPLAVEIPSDATGVEIWFRNWTGADRPAEAYDSNLGQNYRFPVRKP